MKKQYHTNEAVFFNDKEVRNSIDGHALLYTETEKALLDPQVGDIWFTVDRLLDLTDKSTVLFVISHVERNRGGKIDSIHIKHWTGNPYEDILESRLQFSDTVEEISHSHLFDKCNNLSFGVSRTTNYRLQYDEVE